MPNRFAFSERIHHIALTAGLLLAAAAPCFSQNTLHVKWEELTGPDFIAAISKAQGTCLLPIGILEKHGPHMPIGTDLLNVRYVSMHAAEQEYAVVFPEYYFGQIFEAKQEPGTVAYSAKIQLELLQETTDEMSRNGCKKIIIVNGHGGNTSMLPFFGQSQLSQPRDYVIYYSWYPGPEKNTPGRPALKSSFELHAGEAETSAMMVNRPDLLRMDQVGTQSGADLQRLKELPAGLYTPIWWYARFPNHYAGDAAPANVALGEFDMKAAIGDLVRTIRAVKADEVSKKLQDEFFEKSKHPLDTKQ
ncbi:MAG: creatininase family protein [Bryobacteraceae bacterium]